MFEDHESGFLQNTMQGREGHFVRQDLQRWEIEEGWAEEKAEEQRALGRGVATGQAGRAVAALAMAASRARRLNKLRICGPPGP